MFNTKRFIRMLVAVVCAVGSTTFMTQAFGDQDDNGQVSKKRKVNHVSNAKWKSECGACHVAYPPRFLPAESWRAIMAGLDKHFGSNASLDAETAKEITDFLEMNARTKKPEVLDKPLLRITETRWFKSEHGEVRAAVWKNPKVKSPANCGACHTKAESDNYSENNIKIPK